MISSLASATLPPAQILELAQARVLSLKSDDVLKLENAASAQAMRRSFEEAAGVFASTSVILSTLKVDPEVVKATADFGNLLTAGGAFAAAVSLGEPLSIFNSGAGLLGAMGSLFGGGGGDGSQKLLGQVLKEIRGLGEAIRENHRQQLEALRRIAIRIDDVEETINRRLAEIGLDIALLQVDTQELLYEDVRTCERLADEFFLPSTRSLIARGPDGFAVWFEADNHAQDYARCLNGLMARQRITSETAFSSMLRADGVEQDEKGANVADKRNAVRRIEQRILQPTVGYLRRMTDVSDGEALAKQIFKPTPELCDVLSTYSTDTLSSCHTKPVYWPASRIRSSQLNAGQDTLLSAPTALRLSKLTRITAPWNGVIRERRPRAPRASCRPTRSRLSRSAPQAAGRGTSSASTAPLTRST